VKSIPGLQGRIVLGAVM